MEPGPLPDHQFSVWRNHSENTRGNLLLLLKFDQSYCISCLGILFFHAPFRFQDVATSSEWQRLANPYHSTSQHDSDSLQSPNRASCFSTARLIYTHSKSPWSNNSSVQRMLDSFGIHPFWDPISIRCPRSSKCIKSQSELPAFPTLYSENIPSHCPKFPTTFFSLPTRV